MVDILVVAPSPTFRNSLRFALEAEGYGVTAVAWMDQVDQPASSFACTVLDHHGLRSNGPEDRRLLEQFEPIVLLANTPTHPMAAFSFRTLTKPTLGPALSDAVRSAITAGAQ